MSYVSPRQFVEDAGGYRCVAMRLGQAPTTLHSHIQAEKLPSKLFRACCDLARERGMAPPDMSLFSFVELVPLEDSCSVGKSGGLS